MMNKDQKIQLILPMSGQGTRYQKAGYRDPKPLIPVGGVPMVCRVLSHFPNEWPTFFVMAENHRTTDLSRHLTAARPMAEQLFIEPHTKGPSFAVLKAIEKLNGFDPKAPVLISYCDYGMVWDAQQFTQFVRDSNCDACVISYRGYHAHYRSPLPYAYSRLEGERVREIREKGSFTPQREEEFASSGGYYFKTGELLKRAIEYQIEHDLHLKGELYTSLTVEALLQMDPKAHVRVFEIPGFFQWGTPEDLEIFQYWEKSYRAYNRIVGKPRPQVQQVLMPMAGLGSRFQSITTLPKPLIPVAKVPMYERALDSLPQGDTTTIVTLEKLEKEISHPSANKVILKETPLGQALSTEAGLASLNPNGEVLISSCDHAIVLDPDLWNAFYERPNCEAAIFTLRGYPGARNKPNAFAYVSTDGVGRFPQITQVSVKQPISQTPEKDPLLVGTFWFREVKRLAQSIKELKERKIQVNGEMYLDSVFEILISQGVTVREIPLEGYLCWGDPESLAESLYWQEIFCGYRIPLRPKFPGIPKTK